MPPEFDLHTRSAMLALMLIERGLISEVSLDHDLGDEQPDGYFVAERIEQLAHAGTLRPLRWAVHSANPVGRKRMIEALQSADRAWGRI